MHAKQRQRDFQQQLTQRQRAALSSLSPNVRVEHEQPRRASIASATKSKAVAARRQMQHSTGTATLGTDGAYYM